MLRLYILRHAKSSWANPGEKDFDRALNDRGAQDLPLIADAMRKRGYLPDHVYCSPATRTRLTLRGIMPAFGDKPPQVDFEEALYFGDQTSYLDIIRSHIDGSAIMLVGHNPMCEILAASLAGGGDAAALADLRLKYPTGAMAVLDFEADDWSAVRPGSGQLAKFLIPREL